MLFESPLFLAGASAAAVPVVIHFLFRRKARKVRFPSLMLLKRVRKNITRYHRLREMILLLLRVAVILLLVLALAKPFLPGFGHQGAACAVFIIDDSLSMGKLCEGSSRFEVGLEFVNEIINSLDTGSRAGFVLSSLREDGIQEPVEDIALIKEKLRNIKVTGTGVSLSGAIESAGRMVSKERGLPVEIYIVSDRQDEIDGLTGLTDDTKVFYVDCYREEVLTNVVLEEIRVPEGPFPEMSEIEVKAVFVNAGEKQASGKAVFELGNSEQAQDLILGSGERKELVFRTIPLTRGVYGGRISFSLDCIPGDSERFFSIQTGNPMRILVLESEGEVISGQEKYFRSAVNPWGENMDIFVLEHSRPELLSEKRLKDVDMVACFTFLPLIDPGFTLIRDYVKGGGSLLLFPSSDYDIQALNRMWDSLGSLFPWKLVAIDKPVKPVSLRSMDYSYAGLAPLRNIVDPEHAQFLQRYILKTDTGAGSVSVIAEFEDRKPAAVSSLFGSGEVVFFTFGLAGEWTDAPYKNFFAPMMHELTRYLCGRSDMREEYDAGTPVSFRLETDTDQVSVTVPGKEIPIVLSRESGAILRETFQPGCYPYVHKKENETIKGIMVFNPSAEDGRRKPLTPEYLKDKLTAIQGRMIIPDPETARTIGEGRKGRSLRDALLAAAICVLLAELYMSNSMAVRKWKADNAVS